MGIFLFYLFVLSQNLFFFSYLFFFLAGYGGVGRACNGDGLGLVLSSQGVG
jgi:hypothetical protein